MSSGEGVVDLGVVMVGASGEHDTVAAVLLDPVNRLLAHGLDVLVECGIRLVGGVHRGIDLGSRELGAAHAPAPRLGIRHALDGEDLVEAALELNLVVVGHKRVEELDVFLGDVVDVEAQRRGVAHDDGAVCSSYPPPDPPCAPSGCTASR